MGGFGSDVTRSILIMLIFFFPLHAPNQLNRWVNTIVLRANIERTKLQAVFTAKAGAAT